MSTGGGKGECRTPTMRSCGSRCVPVKYSFIQQEEKNNYTSFPSVMKSLPPPPFKNHKLSYWLSICHHHHHHHYSSNHIVEREVMYITVHLFRRSHLHTHTLHTHPNNFFLPLILILILIQFHTNQQTNQILIFHTGTQD